mgnify:FL=1
MDSNIPLPTVNHTDDIRRAFVVSIAMRYLPVVFAACMTAGCHLPIGKPSIIASPLSQAAQEAAILDVAPLGTPREKAVAALETAGITGNYGTRDSIYYCDLWQRPEVVTWQMNLAVLFDEEGRVYKTRTANAQTAVE